MTLSAQKDLLKTCDGIWMRVRTRFGKVRLPWVEWQDLKAIATERVFRNIGRFDVTRGVLSGWVMIVMYRSVQNELRRILPDRRTPDHKWRTNLLCARPLAVRVKQTGRWGEEVVVVEPDILDPAERRDMLCLAEFRDSLGTNDRKVFDAAMEARNIYEASQYLRIGYWTTDRRIAHVARL